MVGLFQLVTQRRQAGAGLLHLGLQGQHILLGGRAQFESLACDVELVLLGLQDGFGCLDLRCQLRLAKRGGDHVSGQSETRSGKLEILIVRLSGQRFQRATVAAEQVEVVVDRDAGVVQGKYVFRPVALADTDRVEYAAVGAEVGVNRWI